MYFRKQSGIGLLELMLSMAIIAILIVMSISYFQSSKNKTLVSAGIEEIQDIVGVIAGLSDPKVSAGDSAGAGKGGLTNSVMYSGSVPKQYVKNEKITTPWGQGSEYTIDYIKADSTTDPDNPVPAYAVINGTGLPNYACTTLRNQFDGNEGLTATCDGTLTINVPLQSRQGIQSQKGDL